MSSEEARYARYVKLSRDAATRYNERGDEEFASRRRRIENGKAAKRAAKLERRRTA